jgi:branched-chain amino acid transport system substrate-binding protein
MQPDLYPKNLLIYLDKFVQQMSSLERADNPKLVLRLIMGWTQGQPLLTKKLLQYTLQSKQKIRAGTEAAIIEKIVKNRLIKDFKQDELTLEIRKLLYRKNLIVTYKLTNGNLSQEQQASLENLRRELGLSKQQCQIITQQYILSDLKTVIHPYFDSANKNKIKPIKFNYTSNNETDYKSASLLSNETVNNQITIAEQNINNKIKRLNPNPSRQKRTLWLCLFIPLLLFFVKDLDWQRYLSLVNIANVDHNQDSCVDLSSRLSPRMSLGEKLLTQKYQNLQPQSMIDFYQGTAAFARCEFSSARNKFQASLAINKNNPEALIYLNNAEAINKQHFKIAVSVPLGNQPDIAREILRGIAQAQAEVNQQGGIQNRLLLVQIVDDRNDPEIVHQLAPELVADKSLIAVVGHNSSNSSLAGSKTYQKHGLLMISPTSTSTELSGVGDYILRTTPNVAVMANTLVNYAAVNSFAKVAVCFDSEDSASSSFVEAFNSELIDDAGEVLKIKCDFAQADFTPQSVIEQAIAQKADALLLAPAVDNMNQAIRVAKANKQQLPLLGNHALYTLQTIKEGKEAMKGMVLPSPWLPDTNGNSSFSRTSIKYWGGKVSWRTAMTYDAVDAILKALKLKQSDDFTRSELQSVITQPDYYLNGVTGKFRFENGDRLGRIQLAYITESEQGSFRLQFSELNVNDKVNQ